MLRGNVGIDEEKENKQDNIDTENPVFIFVHTGEEPVGEFEELIRLAA